MPAQVEQEFKELASEMGRLVAAGHDDHAEDILNLMPEFEKNNLAMRYLLHKSCADPRFRRIISSQSFYVYGCNDYYLRINAWYPTNVNVDEKTRRLLDDYYSIDKCHNHSYDFFTVGLIGPGYVTEFKKSSDGARDKLIGDKISFEKVWTDQLERGRSFYVKKDIIFHTQFVPEAYSSSLNLVIRKRADAKQYVLADDDETVATVYDFRGDDQPFRDGEWR